MVPVQPKLLEQATLERRADRDYVLKVPRETQIGQYVPSLSKPTQKTDPTNIQRKKFQTNPPAPVGAKGRVFPEALATGSFSWGGGATFYAGKTHGTSIKHRNLQHFGTQTASPTFWP